MVQSRIETHRGKLGDTSSYDREFDYLPSRRAKLNVAIRGIHVALGSPCAAS